ncbi:hypothetical protein D3C81_836490 [compost metagenome]
MQRAPAFFLAGQQRVGQALQTRTAVSEWADRRCHRGIGRCRHRLHCECGIGHHRQRSRRRCSRGMWAQLRQRGTHADLRTCRRRRRRCTRLDRQCRRCLHLHQRRQPHRGIERNVGIHCRQYRGHHLLRVGVAVLGHQVLQVGQPGVRGRRWPGHGQRNRAAQPSQCAGPSRRQLRRT